MENIKSTRKCGNMSGNKSLYIIPINEVLSIQFVNESITKITLKESGSFSKVDIMDLDVDSSSDDDYYNHHISGNFRTSEDKNALFKKMRNWRFVVKVIDNNNKPYLYGSLEEPLRFSYNDIKKGNPSQNKEYFLSFYGNTTEPAFLTL